mmetsp:Transcript_3817/g.8426  ORF Transcript_3817/g.8426 Transcript_3817/m.8426 type:complete len:882 (-) Transcript_3817:2-2647(-)
MMATCRARPKVAPNASIKKDGHRKNEARRGRSNTHNSSASVPFAELIVQHHPPDIAAGGGGGYFGTAMGIPYCQEIKPIVSSRKGMDPPDVDELRHSRRNRRAINGLEPLEERSKEDDASRKSAAPLERNRSRSRRSPALPTKKKNRNQGMRSNNRVENSQHEKQTRPQKKAYRNRENKNREKPISEVDVSHQYSRRSQNQKKQAPLPPSYAAGNSHDISELTFNGPQDPPERYNGRRPTKPLGHQDPPTGQRNGGSTHEKSSPSRMKPSLKSTSSSRPRQKQVAAATVRTIEGTQRSSGRKSSKNRSSTTQKCNTSTDKEDSKKKKGAKKKQEKVQIKSILKKKDLPPPPLAFFGGRPISSDSSSSSSTRDGVSAGNKTKSASSYSSGNQTKSASSYSIGNQTRSATSRSSGNKTKSASSFESNNTLSKYLIESCSDDSDDSDDTSTDGNSVKSFNSMKSALRRGKFAAMENHDSSSSDAVSLFSSSTISEDEGESFEFDRTRSHYLRTADLGLTQDTIFAQQFLDNPNSIPEPHYHHPTPHPPPGVQFNIDENWICVDDGSGGHSPIAPQAVDALVNMGYRAACDPMMWTPTSKTRKYMTEKRITFDSLPLPGPLFEGEGGINDKNCLLWSGRFRHRYHGFELPAIRSQGIVNKSAEELVDLLMDSSRVDEYNKASTGRTDEVVLSYGNDDGCPFSGQRKKKLTGVVMHGATIVDGSAFIDDELKTSSTSSSSQRSKVSVFCGVTKLVRSTNKIPLIKKTSEFITLLHCRELLEEQGGNGYIIVGRSITPADDGRSRAVIRSEVLLSVTIIRRLHQSEKGVAKSAAVSDSGRVASKKDLRNRCLLITMNHVKSPLIPKMIAKKIGLSAATGFMSDIRAA